MKREFLFAVSLFSLVFSGCTFSGPVPSIRETRDLREAQYVVACRHDTVNEWNKDSLSLEDIKISDEEVGVVRRALRRIKAGYPEVSDICVDDRELVNRTCMELYIKIKDNDFWSLEALGMEENKSGVIPSQKIISLIRELSDKFGAKVIHEQTAFRNFLHLRIQFPCLVRHSTTSSIYYGFLDIELPGLLGMSNEQRNRYEFCYDFRLRDFSRENQSGTLTNIRIGNSYNDVLLFWFERFTYDARTTDFRNECIKFKVEKDGRGKITKSIGRDIIGNRKTGEMKGIFD